ncbi:hypothetical protein tb265_18610 [Gemmatimonadetes bacterium T265]|nr:hypothetical protein tb265_18610 [Gemmatimonadetes bacterium T265]
MPAVPFDGTFEGWRAAARAALAADLAPAHAVWQPAGDAQHALPLDAPDAAPRPAPAPNAASVPAAHPAAAVPRRFLALGAMVACHRDPERWATLYRVLWRLTRGGEPHLLAVAVDPDVLQLARMAKAVRREVHKLHAFVRFRLVRAADGVDEYVAWFEPEHDVVEQAAELFVRRFANMRWAVLTPRVSVRWDGAALSVGPGVPRRAAPSADALEHLWGTYYAHVFNPARVKLQAMRAEMPKRYWRNLPEAPLIAPMVRDAPARVRRMVEAAATRRTPAPAAVGAAPDAAPPAAEGRADDECADHERADEERGDAGYAVAPRRVGRALVYAGTSAWERDDADALAPNADPPPDAAARLRHYAARYPLAVAASTRARVFAPALAALWAARAPAGLLFDVYAHTALLGGPVRPHRLPRAVRDLLPPALAGAERVAGEHVPDAVRDALHARFRAAVDVLAGRGALGAVLVRAPREFGPSRERAEALRGCLARWGGLPIAVEFEHPEWSSGRLRARTDALLAEQGATRVLAPGEEANPGPLAVVRGGEPASIARVADRVASVHVLGATD